VGASSDIDVGVNRRGELAEWLSRDPIRRIEECLKGIDFAGERARIEEEIGHALTAARSAPLPLSTRVSDHVWEERCAN
jgi:TPP-dependent pyruvate/acetoin dehydrogenase alpha subunit